MNQSSAEGDAPTVILNLVDISSECLRSFENLDQKISGFSETLLIYLILQKLGHSIKLWRERQIKE